MTFFGKNPTYEILCISVACVVNFKCCLLPSWFIRQKIDGPIDLSNGKSIAVGDTVYFGRGTRPSGDFMYLNNAANVLVGVPEIPFNRSYVGMHAVIEQIRVAESKKIGKKVYAVIKQGRNVLIDIEPAIQTGEIAAINGEPTGNSSATNSSPVSVADELLKLKQLLDAGAITQSEYDQQKKKLLNN